MSGDKRIRTMGNNLCIALDLAGRKWVDTYKLFLRQYNYANRNLKLTGSERISIATKSKLLRLEAN